VLLPWEDGNWTGAGVALLAFEGKEAWCGGLAVAPEQRRRGAAAQLMQMLQQRAQMQGAATLHLEVLAGNAPARALYARLGYQEVRELLIWERSHRQGTLPIPYERLEPADPTEILANFHHWHDLQPAWQRRFPYLQRIHSLMDGYTISAKDGMPVAYVLYHHRQQGRNSQETVQIFDIAVDPAADTAAAGCSLLQALQLQYMDADLILVNEPADSKFSRILAALGFYVTDRQYELVRQMTEG
jgi:ribosomal protein S18 acetylase RimI-like enzyme